MNGFLGSYELIDNLTQSVAQCTTDRYASATLNLCNRSDNETCYVDIAITTVQSNFNTTSRYIEFNSIIGPNTSLQRNGILISAGEFLTVVYRGQDPRCLSANTWAVQSGADAGLNPIALIVPGPPVIVTTSLPDADQDIAYSQQIVVTSSREIVNYSIIAGTLPTGLSLNSTTGIISGIPSGADQTFTFTVRVIDSVDSTAEQEFTITKLPNSTPPVWVTPSSLGLITIDQPYSLQLEVDEIGVVTYALVSGSLPTGLSLSSSGLISGTPTVAETASFVVSATNASSVSANQSFTIEVAVATGEARFVTPGTYSWVAPAGVTSVSAVTVGGGGAGCSAHDSNGGGGGSLGWKNSIAVTPGQTYTVVVGAGGTATGNGGGVGTAGAQSYFISTGTVRANGGAAGPATNAGPTANNGGFVGDGGGGGGYGTGARGGGCGAGGYTGLGGLARATNQNPTAPASGSGGGSAGVTVNDVQGAAGGGVGLFGLGTNGINPTYSTSWNNNAWGYSLSNANAFLASQGGRGGSGGGNPTVVQNGSGSYPFSSTGGFPGGGGSGAYNNTGPKGGNGGHGAVRIIWGESRAFPSTNVDEASSIDDIYIDNVLT